MDNLELKICSYGGCHGIFNDKVAIPWHNWKKVCALNEKTKGELNKMEFWKGVWLWNLHITDKFKQQATYPEGGHKEYKQEYLDQSI